MTDVEAAIFVRDALKRNPKTKSKKVMECRRQIADAIRDPSLNDDTPISKEMRILIAEILPLLP